jgi:oxaloacetate decarboxylase gamma subunit
MIFEGIKLMFIGMTTVLLFLFLMILLIQLTSYLTRGATAREIEGIRIARELLAQKKKKAAASSDTDEDIAVIAAAVTAYEVERFAQA